MHIVIYAKISDGKKKGLSFDGPHLSQECFNLSDAQDVANSLVSDSREIVLARIFDLDKTDLDKAKDQANAYFWKSYEDMQLASKMLEKPIKKRKKRKKTKKST